MNALKRALVTTAAIAGLVSASSPAQAATMNFINNWDLNLAAAVQGLTGSVDGIKDITYTGLSHVTINAAGAPAVGDTFTVNGLLTATSFAGKNNVISHTGLNDNYEITTEFSVQGTITKLLTGGSFEFGHLTTGTLNMYLDNMNSPKAQSNPLTAVGYTDGTLIGTFNLVHNTPGTGGTYYTGSANGADDAWFDTVYQAPGVFLNAAHTPLNSALAGVWTDSTIKNITDPALIPLASDWAAAFAAVGVADNGLVNPLEFYVQEDGMARIATPEPGTLVLLGAGLFGLAIARKRRQA